ncbi:hypothetical protein DID88_009672 [Monilinia fructigena]|uniref:RNase H type-1 domain-containing protein n=1 Tax=Monilinia fructigena TaxID=38457 RepID=A0A395IDM7_9HELO|nr:hypothetical protein DID88_009672 [Monilinia fructigena]
MDNALVPRAPRPILAQSHFSPGCRTDPTEGRTKEAAAEHFNAWWSQLGRDTITVFSDGTEQYKDGAKLVGYGYAVYRGQTLARTGSGAINSISHVFDAEAIGALKGLQCALDILQPTDGRIWMCIDSTSVIWCMRANASNTSQWAFLECHTLIDRYKVGIKWSPGHMGIEGNEAADELAKHRRERGRTDDDRSAEPTISGIGTTAKALADIATSDWWSQCHPGLSASYRRWKLGYSVTEPPELRLPVQCYIGSWLPERHTAISRSTTEGSATPKRSSPASAGSRRLPTTSYSARSPNASFTPGRLDPNARPAAPRKGGDT